MRVPIKLANPDRMEDLHEVDQALVDTGATWTVVPGDLARGMGLRVVGETRLPTATGPQVLSQSYAFFE
ncbi:MAG TPA: aspartyl protease family protein, partial [Dehalococcoidia bacterium]|nr:aspartyl protease family protein [Dehalococcoidia bacterium]